MQSRVRRLNDLGFAVEEIGLEPGGEGRVRLRVAVSRRDFHARELRRRTGLVALEGQARLLLNDLREYRAWLEWTRQHPVEREEGAARWRSDVLDPFLARLAPAVGPGRDALQAYCDLLEHKWLLSEAAGRDVGLEAALASYLAIGAPAPEEPQGRRGSISMPLRRLDPCASAAGSRARQPSRHCQWSETGSMSVARQARPSILAIGHAQMLRC